MVTCRHIANSQTFMVNGVCSRCGYSYPDDFMLDELPLSMRAYNILVGDCWGLAMKTVGEVRRAGYSRIHNVKNCGQKTIREIERLVGRLWTYADKEEQNCLVPSAPQTSTLSFHHFLPVTKLTCVT